MHRMHNSHWALLVHIHVVLLPKVYYSYNHPQYAMCMKTISLVSTIKLTSL